MFLNANAFIAAFASMAVIFILAGLLLIAHVIWIVRVYRMDRQQGRSLAICLGRLLLVTLTPLVSFYVAKFCGWAALPPDEKPSRRRLVLPLAALVFIVVVSFLLYGRYGVSAQQTLWGGGFMGLAGMFGRVTAYYVVFHLILYMLAQVSGGSRHSLWTSDTHFVTILVSTGALVPLLLA